MVVRRYAAWATIAMLLLSVSFGALLPSGSAAIAAPKSKVGICHVTNSSSNPYTYIEVSQNAVAAHQAHGDIIGVSSAADCPTAPPQTCGDVAGQVMDVADNPIAGATVSIAGQSTTTDDGGQFTFQCIDAGDYTITAGADGYSDGSADIAVVAGQTASARIVLDVLPTCGSLTGQVTDAATGAAIVDATISVAGLSTSTDESGNYAFDCVEPGSQTASGSAAGYDDGSIEVTIVAGQAAIGDLQLSAAPTCGTVSGTITDATTGATIAGSTVSIAGQTSTTDMNGSYSFDCIAAADQDVTATADGYSDGSVTVTVVAGVTTTADIALSPTQTCGSISGQITASNTGDPIAGATVSAAGQSATTDENGNYSFSCIAVGTYTVSATADGYATGERSNVAVQSGANTDVNIALVPATSTCSNGSNGPITIVLSWNSQSDTVPPDLDSHLAGPDGQGGTFHVAYYAKNPVPYASLDVDDTTWAGPETVTITIDPSTDAFVAGDYQYWVHNYSNNYYDAATFATSGAVVTISQCDMQLAQYSVADVSGDPSKLIWDVVVLHVDANGNVTLSSIQTFVDGDQYTIP